MDRILGAACTISGPEWARFRPLNGWYGGPAAPARRCPGDASCVIIGPPNFVEEPSDASGFFDPETWHRLRQVKALYDPSDRFKANHPIPPSAELG